MRLILDQLIISDTVAVKNWGLSGHPQIGQFHQHIAQCQRADISYRNKFDVQEVQLLNRSLFDRSNHVIFFEQKYMLTDHIKEFDESLETIIDSLEDRCKSFSDMVSDE